MLHYRKCNEQPNENIKNKIKWLKQRQAAQRWDNSCCCCCSYSCCWLLWHISSFFILYFAKHFCFRYGFEKNEHDDTKECVKYIFRSKFQVLWWLKWVPLLLMWCCLFYFTFFFSTGIVADLRFAKSIQHI